MNASVASRPDRHAPGAWAARLLVTFGALTVAHWFVASAHLIGQSVADLGFALLLGGLTVVVARGLLGGARWARWGAFALAGTGIFFVAPVAATILLGGGAEPIGTGWDVVYFPLALLLLTAVIAVLLAPSRGGASPTR